MQRATVTASAKLGLLVVIVVASFLGARHLELSHGGIVAVAQSARGLRDARFAIPLFLLAYAIGGTLGVPGSLLTITGGVVFGFELGTLLNWAGATLAATGGYWLARLLGRDAVERIGGRKIYALERLADAHAFSTVLRLRLIPVLPFNALNFACGLVGLDFASYTLGTVLGDLPVTAAYTYFADALLSGVTGARRAALWHASLAGGLLIALSFVPGLVKRIRQSRP
ncbi:MAG: TVP38/TMEM64 family protein [Gemmatimonadota bacterium]|nr:TVP38/TMEM64 family protein [Gemmatimonadota bacterium]